MLFWSRCENTDLCRPDQYFVFLGELSATVGMEASLPPSLLALVCSVLSLLSLTVILLLCLIKRKRRMEGTYQPSAEERKQARATGSEKPGLRLPLPLPKEERLI